MIAEVHDNPEGLPRSTLLRQLAELDRSEPPPQLDRAVLEQARRTIQAVPASRAGHSLRWIGAAAMTLVLAAIATVMLRPGPKVIARRIAAPPPREARTLPLPAAARAGPAASPSLVLVAPASSAPLVPIATVRRDSHVLYAIRPLRLRLMATSAPPPSPKIGSPSLLETDARARVMIEIPRAGPESHPQEWLRRIRQLRAEGRTADADREWAAFNKVYSTYPATRGLDPVEQPLGK